MIIYYNILSYIICLALASPLFYFASSTLRCLAYPPPTPLPCLLFPHCTASSPCRALPPESLCEHNSILYDIILYYMI